jgi:hypothetical protein
MKNNNCNLTIDRLKLVNRDITTTNRIQAQIAANPAVIAAYIGIDPVTGLAITARADGSVGYQKQIFVDPSLAVGDILPATITGSNGIGFIDGLTRA